MKLPFRSVPICAQPCGDVLAPGFDVNSKPNSWPEHEIVETAGAISPRKAAGSVGGTASPLPRGTAGPVASHSARKSTRAGVSFGPKNWNVSMTGRFFTCRTARRLFILKSTALLRTSSVQKSPDGGIPPLKSCCCDPEPGSKRSIQTKANAPRCVTPSTTYWPSKARMSVSRLYVLPSLPRALPTWNARALEPLKSVIVASSTSNPWRVKPVNGSVIDGSPGANTWMTPKGGPRSVPPGIGFGGVTTALDVTREDAATVDEGHASLANPAPATAPAVPITNLRRLSAASSGWA